jgi:UDP-N-acetyl-D-mannosaminuronic acid transferase (WecB/TagA/CpsF family)
MPLQFINIHGQAVDPTSPIYAAKKRAPKEEKSETFSRGLCVSGFSPEMIERAKAEHEVKAAASRARGKELDPFTVDAHIRQAKPKKLPRRFHVADAAQQYAQMLVSAGWVGVTVQHDRPKGKGGANA